MGMGGKRGEEGEGKGSPVSPSWPWLATRLMDGTIVDYIFFNFFYTCTNFTCKHFTGYCYMGDHSWIKNGKHEGRLLSKSYATV